MCCLSVGFASAWFITIIIVVGEGEEGNDDHVAQFCLKTSMCAQAICPWPPKCQDCIEGGIKSPEGKSVRTFRAVEFALVSFCLIWPVLACHIRGWARLGSAWLPWPDQSVLAWLGLVSASLPLICFWLKFETQVPWPAPLCEASLP